MQVRRRRFWGIQSSPDGKKRVMCFPSEKDRDCWAKYSVDGLTACFGPNHGIVRETLDARSPIVRKINRMIATGVEIKFPVEI